MSEIVSAFAIGLLSGSTSVVFAIFIGRKYLGSYLAQKGKNKADVEDIQRLTDMVEEIKTLHARQLRELGHGFDLLLEQKKTSNQLRLAALDKRLEVHQQAFTLWRNVLAHVYEEQSSMAAVIQECQSWWEKNCLYLEPDARSAFVASYSAAAMHQTLLHGPRDTVSVEQIKDNWATITRAAAVIMDSVALPPLSVTEKKRAGATEENGMPDG